MLLLVATLLIVASLGATWYWLALGLSRRRAQEITHWLGAALLGKGQVLQMVRLSATRLRFPLRMAYGVFRRASVLVELAPYELPWKWLLAKIRQRPETLTFQADLDLPPAFALHVQNFRWFGSSTRKCQHDRGEWTFENTGPFVISTRVDWQKDVPGAVMSLAQVPNEDFLSVAFQRSSPHFSVTVPLESIAPGSPIRSLVFENMKELAGRSSASHL